VKLAAPTRNLALELVRVTEAAALAAGRFMGRGDKEAADAAASESQYAETAEPGPDETYLAEEEKRLLDQNKEQVAKGTEVDEQKRT